MADQLLLVVLFFPLLASVALAVLPAALQAKTHTIALALALAELAALGLLAGLTVGAPADAEGMWVYLEVPWLSVTLSPSLTLQTSLALGVDGLSLVLLVLTGLVFSLAVLMSHKIAKRQRAYYSLLFLLMTAVIGSFLALDFLVFFLFFEFMLLPMYFLIGMWGGTKRHQAALKFLIYTLVGSVAILGGMLLVAIGYGGDFNLLHMHHLDRLVGLSADDIWAGVSWRALAFFLLLGGLLVKLPAVPVHTWLPLAHVEAATPISMVLAGVLLKVGGYGLLRIVGPVFPDMMHAYGEWIVALGGISIFYAAMVALAQADVKKMVAYSSVSHMGFVLLGFGTMAAVGTQAAAFQLVSHGLLSPALFVMAGVLQSRVGSRRIDDFRGLQGSMPLFATAVVPLMFASLGLPGFSGFIGEFMALLAALGAVGAGQVHWVWPLLAGLGIVVTAGFLLWTLQRLFWGQPWTRSAQGLQALTDLDWREGTVLFGLAGLSLLFGLWPRALLDVLQPWLDRYDQLTLEGLQALAQF